MNASLPAIGLLFALTTVLFAAPPDPRRERLPEGGLQPQVAVDEAGTVHLITFHGEAGAGNVVYRTYASQSGFSKVIPVNSTPGSVIAAGTIRGAQLALGRNGRVHVAWMGSKHAQPRGPEDQAPLMYTRLNDAGTAFEPERNVIRSEYGLDGGGTLAADDTGRVYVVWHAGEGRGEAARRVWMAVSKDDGRTFAPETAIDTEKKGACGCCGIRAAASGGQVLVLYRSAENGMNRDMQLLSSTDGGRTFVSTLLSRWAVAQCPMSSASLTRTKDGFLAAWETQGQISVAAVDRRGKVSKPVQPGGPPENRKHPVTAVNAQGETLLVWAEGTGWNRGGKLAWLVIDAKGKTGPVRSERNGIATWSFAAPIANPDGSFVILH